MFWDTIRRSKATYNGMYRGKVEDNIDPKEQGRVKVRIHPMMTAAAITAEMLPWAIPAFSLAEGSGAGFGSFHVPRIDAMVWVFFEMGDPMQPVYFAEAADGVHGLPAWRTTNYPNRKGVEFENGMIIWMDESTNEVWIEHPTGTFVQIDTVGSVFVDSVESVKVTAKSVIFDTPMVIATHSLEALDAATGTFLSADGKIVTVIAGIITSIV